MTDAKDPEQIAVEIRAKVPQHDAFRRKAPPGAASKREAWGVAAQYIDYGNAMFANHNRVRAVSPTRDLVVAALLRRALITMEGILTVLYRGLPEAAIPLVRTLLDIKVNTRLVVQDASEHTAKRLAAYHYFAIQQHQQGVLTDRSTRAMLATFDGAKEETAEIARRNKQLFESEGFAEVRGEIVAGKPWHGFPSAEDAFRAVGLTEDYYQTYDGGTLFVHAANIDFDFDSIVDGRVMLKGPLTADEMMLLPILGVALSHLHDILTIFVTDKHIEDQEAVLSVGTDHTETLTTLEAMGFLLTHALPSRSEMAGDEPVAGQER